MPSVRVYTSDLASARVADLALGLAQRSGLRVQLRPLGELPAPLTERLGPLRLERAELQQALATAEWCLEQFASGQWQPDAALQNGLLADQNAFATRLRGVELSLAALERGERQHG